MIQLDFRSQSRINKSDFDTYSDSLCSEESDSTETPPILATPTPDSGALILTTFINILPLGQLTVC